MALLPERRGIVEPEGKQRGGEEWSDPAGIWKWSWPASRWTGCAWTRGQLQVLGLTARMELPFNEMGKLREEQGGTQGVCVCVDITVMVMASRKAAPRVRSRFQSTPRPDVIESSPQPRGRGGSLCPCLPTYVHSPQQTKTRHRQPGPR